MTARMKAFLLVVACGCLATSVVSADDAVLDAGLPPSAGEKNTAFGAWPIVQVPGEDYDIKLFRMSIPIGKHRSFTGLDIGLLANLVTGRSSGVAFTTVGNMVGRGEALVQFAAVFNSVENVSSGMQISCANVAGDDYMGFQLGPVNLSGLIGGLQLGIYNQAERVGGMQFGLVNVAGELNGVQFGLLNIASESSVPVLPILHIGY